MVIVPCQTGDRVYSLPAAPYNTVTVLFISYTAHTIYRLYTDAVLAAATILISFLIACLSQSGCRACINELHQFYLLIYLSLQRGCATHVVCPLGQIYEPPVAPATAAELL